MSHGPLKLLQITDLHYRGEVPGTCEIARRRSRHIPQLLDRIEALLPELQPDAVAVTGDLLHAPYGLFRGANPFAVEDMAENVKRDYAYLKRRFDAWQVPYIALPGNHDHEAGFEAIFGRAGELEVGGYRLVAFHDREWEANIPWRRDEQRQRFEDFLRSADARPQIHLQHYVLHPAVDHPYPHNYGDREDLLGAMAGSERVRLSIAGHFHDGSALNERDGVLHAICPALCEPPHPVRLIEISDDGTVEARDIPLYEKGEVRRLVVVSRDDLLAPSAHFRDSSGVVLADDIGALKPLIEGATIVCASSLDRDDLASLDWPGMADAHDRLHQRLAEHGIVLDAIYYTTALAPEAASAAGLPRIALGPGQSVALRAIADLRLDPSVVETAAVDGTNGHRQWTRRDLGEVGQANP
ncbi:MAG: metallophosphoesterase [Mesorhizobium sp.]|nr:metallophosphoesterase [Mesorhizobium sp.]